MKSVVWLVSLAVVEAAAAQAPGTPVAIRHVTVIDGTGAAPLPDATVIIRGRIIESIGPSRSAKVPAGTRVIEGAGRYLIPGLIDTHMHIAAVAGTPQIERILRMTLAQGITGLRDASGVGHERALVELRGRIERGDLLAPRLYVSGSGTPQNVPRYHAAGLADLIRQLHAIGVDGIKLRNLTSVEADTVIRESRAAGLPVFGHTYGREPNTNFTLRALGVGATGVMHILGIGPAATLQPRTLLATEWQADWLGLYLHWLDASAAEESQLLDAFLSSGAWLEPTLTADAFVLHDEWYRNRPENRLLSDLWGMSYEQLRSGFPAFTGSDLELGRQGFQRMEAFLRRFHEAGGVVLAGTDMLPWPTVGLHEELRLLVHAGLSPLAALQAATRDNARALGWEARTGTIAIGRDADLLLLDGNPLEDISNTKRIRVVVRAGRVLDRAALDSLRTRAGAP